MNQQRSLRLTLKIAYLRWIMWASNDIYDILIFLALSTYRFLPVIRVTQGSVFKDNPEYKSGKDHIYSKLHPSGKNLYWMRSWPHLSSIFSDTYTHIHAFSLPPSPLSLHLTLSDLFRAPHKINNVGVPSLPYARGTLKNQNLTRDRNLTADGRRISVFTCGSSLVDFWLDKTSRGSQSTDVISPE